MAENVDAGSHAAGAEPAAAAAEPADPGARTEPHGDAITSATLGPGSVLADRYRLVRCIGEGGMGAVWQAEHLALDTAVAIKLINPAQVDDERARTRFLREARAAASLRSPHVVQIFDYGLHGSVPYIAMELLDGESLAQRLAGGAKLGPERVLDIVVQVGRAVAKAHDAGLVHRDLKPDNIYLVAGEDGAVAKVLDFGIAKRALESGGLEATTRVGGVLGTPYYMSPEQLVDASSADAQCDLWSLAVIAYECLLGERPFRASSIAELAVAVLTEPRPVPSTRGEVPPGFDAWFLRATRREPDQRFADVREMVDALAVALGLDATRSSASLPTVDTRVGPTAGVSMAGATVSSGSRRSGGATLLWVAAIGGVVLAAIALRQGDPPPPRRDAAVVPVAAEPAPTATRAPTSPQPEPAPHAALTTDPVRADPAPSSAVPAATAEIEPALPRRKSLPKKPRDRAPDSVPPQHDVNELEP